MELIDKIQEYCKGVQEQEVKKDNDDYSSGKFAVASVVLKIIKKHEPEPPTVRPMSELPEGNVNITVLYDSADFGRFWEDGSSHNGLVYLDKGGRFKKRENYSNCYKEKLLGWIPKQELPNPNDIKL